MKKTLVILAMVLVSTSVFADRHRDNDRHDRDIHGSAFTGNTNIQTNNGNNNGGNPQTGGNGQGNNGQGNGNLPSVPVPGAVWLFGSALAGFLTISRSRKK